MARAMFFLGISVGFLVGGLLLSFGILAFSAGVHSGMNTPFVIGAWSCFGGASHIVNMYHIYKESK